MGKLSRKLILTGLGLYSPQPHAAESELVSWIHIIADRNTASSFCKKYNYLATMEHPSESVWDGLLTEWVLEACFHVCHIVSAVGCCLLSSLLLFFPLLVAREVNSRQHLYFSYPNTSFVVLWNSDSLFQRQKCKQANPGEGSPKHSNMKRKRLRGM